MVSLYSISHNRATYLCVHTLYISAPSLTPVQPIKGPKFVCGVDILATKAKSNAGCLVYSVGSNNQVDFERGVKQFM